MALDGALNHPKIRKLARLLKLDPCMALGVMEAIWNTTRKLAPNGAIGRISNDDIADQIHYSGDPNFLVAAIVEATLFDEHRLHRLIVHNWHVRSDNTLDAQLFRRGERYANGSMPRGTKLGDKERAKYAHLWPQPAESLFDQQPVPSVDGAAVAQNQAAENVVSITAGAALHGAAGSLPEPAPATEPVPDPVPVPATTPTPPPSRREARRTIDAQIASLLPSSPGKALDAAARHVLQGCSISGMKTVSMHTVLWCAIDAECQRVHKPPDEHAMAVAEVMVGNYAQYVQDSDLLDYRWSIRTFFEEGHWRNWRSWPINRKAAEERQRAQTGYSVH